MTAKYYEVRYECAQANGTFACFACSDEQALVLAAEWWWDYDEERLLPSFWIAARWNVTT